MTDTTTEEGRNKRLAEFVKGYEQSHNRVGLVRLIGGSVNDFGDYTEADAGEPPRDYETVTKEI